MAKLLLIRHGQSYTNSKAHKTAANDQNFLTPKGFMDTLQAGIEFAEHGVSFDYACCSTYPRTFLTASAFLSGAGHKPITVEEHADFRERAYGFTEYMPTSILEEMYGGEVIQGWDDHLDTVPGDPTIGETQQQVYDRVIPLFESLILPKLEDNQNVLCVNHFYVMRALLSHIQVGSAAMMPNLKAKNSQPFMFDYVNGKFLAS